MECFDWLEKAFRRKLINEKEYIELKTELEKLPKSINGLIKFTNLKLKE